MYATRAAIEAIYGEDLLLVLTDRNDVGAVDDAAIAAALTRAAALIDSTIGRRVTLPLVVIPEILRTCAVDIAIYYLASTADFGTEEQRKRYDDAVIHLRRIGDGKAALPVDANDDGIEETEPAVVSTSGPPRIFSRETLRDL